jgi:hypothetical protein
MQFSKQRELDVLDVSAKVAKTTTSEVSCQHQTRECRTDGRNEGPKEPDRNDRLEKMLIKLLVKINALEQTQWRRDAAKFRRLSERSNQTEENRQTHL